MIPVLLLLASPVMALAQEGAQAKTNYMANPLFVFLLAVIVLLLALIAVLAFTVQNIARSEYMVAKVQRMKERANGAGKAGVLFLFVLLSLDTFGQGGQAIKGAWRIAGLDYFTFYFMLGVIICEVAVIAILIFVMHNLLKEDKERLSPVLTRTGQKTILEKLNASVEIEREEEIMLTHDYDGIRELDNNLPPWWKYGFYATIVFAVAYMIHFHVSRTGDLQTAEYNKEVARAEKEVAEYLKTSASNVDETNVRQLTESSDIAAGKEIFTGICATCHGKAGEGNAIGPNLTDAYWLHGGSIQDVFKSIKYGWPDKGMQAWKDSYSPMQIAQLASYIRSLKGTNPSNAKDKQGELYIEGAASDSTRIDSDSLRVMPEKDSIQKSVSVN